MNSAEHPEAGADQELEALRGRHRQAARAALALVAAAARELHPVIEEAPMRVARVVLGELEELPEKVEAALGVQLGSFLGHCRVCEAPVFEEDDGWRQTARAITCGACCGDRS